MPQNKNRSKGCSGFFANLASSAYNLGGKAQTTGGALATAGALAQLGDLTPAAPGTITVGGSAVIVGTSIGVGGAVIQGLAGLYYLAHGNSSPLASTIIGAALGKVFDAIPGAEQHPGIGYTAETEAEAATGTAPRESNNACKPQ